MLALRPCVDWVQAKIGLTEAEQQPIIRAMVRSYVEGLAWVMRYYYDGETLYVCPCFAFDNVSLPGSFNSQHDQACIT